MYVPGPSHPFETAAPTAASQKRSKIMTPEKVKTTKIVAALGLLAAVI
jgi:hypothetical protein